jgi:hypothetical protein
MKITSSQLRTIINEEVKNLREAADFGTALASGTLAGVGRGVIKSALLALSDADFDKFRLAFKDASNEKKSGASFSAMKGAAAALDPATLASKIQKSLGSSDWSWTGASPSRPDYAKQDAVKYAVDGALGMGYGADFLDALVYVTGDGDTFRKMSDEEADDLYDSSLAKVKQIAKSLASSKLITAPSA